MSTKLHELIGNLGSEIANNRITTTEIKIAATLCAFAGAVASDDPDLLAEWFNLAEDQTNRFLAKPRPQH